VARQRLVVKVDDSQTVTFLLWADDQVQGWLKPTTPELIVRCQEHKSDVFVVTGMAAQPELGELHRVHRAGCALTRRQPNASGGHSRETTRHCSPRIPFRSGRRLARAKRLRVESTPFQANPAVVTFDVRGFRETPADRGRVQVAVVNGRELSW
jgi:hypothetical protein